VDPPEVRYVRSGDVWIAYQTVGEGPLDLVFVPTLLSPIFSWYVPQIAEFFRRLASFSRLILFDKRGTGASDRPRALATLEVQMEDVRAVLDAVGSSEASFLGSGPGAQVAALFAATYPERTQALVLFSAWARLPGSSEEHRRMLRGTSDHWGRRGQIEEDLSTQYPSTAGDASFRRWMTLAMQATASPTAATEFRRAMAEGDVSDILPAIQAPTLILYPKLSLELAVPPAGRGLRAEAERLAAAIPSAQVIELEGPDLGVYRRDVADEAERFLSAPQPRAVSDRVLATVLFTDLVSSTTHLASLGDAAWRDLLTQHRHSVRVQLQRFRGDEMDTAGDGFFAAFDGPARAIACAHAIIADSEELGLSVRAGIHTGECERVDDKLAGIAVHLGARIAARAGSGEVLVSSTVKDLVAGSGIDFTDRGQHELKGIPGTWRLYATECPE
jgi:class 3 adenylate cyclase